MPSRIFLSLGTGSAFLAVLLGAFGAHGLKTILTPDMLTVWQTAVNYQMWHGMGLILIALLQQLTPSAKLLHWAGCLMSAGIVLFSGSLYSLALTQIKALGIITPIGGVCFLFAWCFIFFYSLKKHSF